MNIAIASDHRGIDFKLEIKSILNRLGHNVNDFGPFDNKESVDYPDYGFKVAMSVSNGENLMGILICGTGIGMSLVANKINGVRAALCHNSLTCEMSRKHNNANVLCLGTDIIDKNHLATLIKVWVTTDFEGGRHERRINKIMKLECD